MSKNYHSTTANASYANNLLSSLLRQEDTYLDKASLNIYLSSLLAGRTPEIDTEIKINSDWIKMPSGWIETLVDKVSALHQAIGDSLEADLSYSEDIDEEGNQVHTYDEPITDSSWSQLLDEQEWLEELETALQDALLRIEHNQTTPTPSLVNG